MYSGWTVLNDTCRRLLQLYWHTDTNEQNHSHAEDRGRCRAAIRCLQHKDRTAGEAAEEDTRDKIKAGRLLKVKELKQPKKSYCHKLGYSIFFVSHHSQSRRMNNPISFILPSLHSPPSKPHTPSTPSSIGCPSFSLQHSPLFQSLFFPVLSARVSKKPSWAAGLGCQSRPLPPPSHIPVSHTAYTVQQLWRGFLACYDMFQ